MVLRVFLVTTAFVLIDSLAPNRPDWARDFEGLKAKAFSVIAEMNNHVLLCFVERPESWFPVNPLRIVLRNDFLLGERFPVYRVATADGLWTSGFGFKDHTTLDFGF